MEFPGRSSLSVLCPGQLLGGSFPQDSDISEHVKELQLSDSAASDPKSFPGLVSLRWGAAEWGEGWGSVRPCGSFAWHPAAWGGDVRIQTWVLSQVWFLCPSAKSNTTNSIGLLGEEGEVKNVKR